MGTCFTLEVHSKLDLESEYDEEEEKNSYAVKNLRSPQDSLSRAPPSLIPEIKNSSKENEKSPLIFSSGEKPKLLEPEVV